MGEYGWFGGGYGEEPLRVRDLEEQARTEADRRAEKKKGEPREGDPKVWEQRKRTSGP